MRGVFRVAPHLALIVVLIVTPFGGTSWATSPDCPPDAPTPFALTMETIGTAVSFAADVAWGGAVGLAEGFAAGVIGGVAYRVLPWVLYAGTAALFAPFTATLISGVIVGGVMAYGLFALADTLSELPAAWPQMSVQDRARFVGNIPGALLGGRMGLARGEALVPKKVMKAAGLRGAEAEGLLSKAGDELVIEVHESGHFGTFYRAADGRVRYFDGGPGKRLVARERANIGRGHHFSVQADPATIARVVARIEQRTGQRSLACTVEVCGLLEEAGVPVNVRIPTTSRLYTRLRELATNNPDRVQISLINQDVTDAALQAAMRRTDLVIVGGAVIVPIETVGGTTLYVLSD